MKLDLARKRISSLLTGYWSSFVPRASGWIDRRSLGSIVAFSILVRLPFLPFFYHNADMPDFWFMSSAIFNIGMNSIPYHTQYGPGLFYILILVTWPYYLWQSKLWFSFLFKLPMIACEAAIVVMIYRLTGSKSRSVLMAIAPLSIIVTSVHGQFDAYVAFFVLSSFYLLSKKKYAMAAIAIAAATAFKYVAVLLVVPLFVFLVTEKSGGHERTRRLLVFFSAFATMTLLLFLPMFQPYAGVPLLFTVFSSPFASTGGGVWRGSSINLQEFLVVDLGLSLPNVTLILFLEVLFVAALSFRFLHGSFGNLIHISLVQFLLVYLGYPTLHMQHLVWVLPLILLARRPLLPFALLNGLIVPKLLSGNLLFYLSPDVRTLLNLNPVEEINVFVLQIGYFWVTLWLLFLIWRFLRLLPSTSIRFMPLGHLGGIHYTRSSLGIIIIVVAVLVSALTIIPSLPFEEDSRFRIGQDMYLTWQKFYGIDANTTASVMLRADDAFVHGYASDVTRYTVKLNTSTPITANLTLNNVSLGFLLNTTQGVFNASRAILTENTLLDIYCQEPCILDVNFLVLVNMNDLVPYYRANPWLVPLAAVSAVTPVLCCVSGVYRRKAVSPGSEADDS